MPTPFFLSPSPTAVVWLTGWQMEEDGLRIAVTAQSETMGDSIVRSVASSTDVFRARPRVGVTGFLVTLDAVSVDSDLSIQNERPSTIDRFGAVSSPSVPRNARPIFSATR
jgi:hypothetical protein